MLPNKKLIEEAQKKTYIIYTTVADCKNIIIKDNIGKEISLIINISKTPSLSRFLKLSFVAFFYYDVKEGNK